MKHFTLKEFVKSDTARRLGIDNTPSPQVEERLRQLVDYVLDPLREAYGRPIYVNSGYRCPALNRAVGGVAHSQHLTGEAADITGGNCQENRRLYELLRQLQLPVDQVINEHGFTWLHVSYGPRHRRMFL
ncbi:MAG TPA: peptidase M15 [Candidatus Avimuribaculum pullicola]|nr:peptidase M15 [Candidatus Avimuribaculum pullicola]